MDITSFFYTISESMFFLSRCCLDTFAWHLNRIIWNTLEIHMLRTGISHSKLTLTTQKEKVTT